MFSGFLLGALLCGCGGRGRGGCCRRERCERHECRDRCRERCCRVRIKCERRCRCFLCCDGRGEGRGEGGGREERDCD